MKPFLLFLFISLVFQDIEAQENYVDSLYSVNEVKTITYAEKQGERLIINLYFPESTASEKLPLIIFMHGGGFAGGSPKNPQEVKFAKLAASRGYAVGLISYRLPRKGEATGFGCDFGAEGKLKTFRMAAEDFMDAVKFMVQHAESYNIDHNTIIAGGSSAGAEAVLNAVYNPNLMFKDISQYEDIDLAAVFSLAGAIVDSRYIDKQNAVPGIFFHGTDDNLVPYATAPHHYCKKGKPGYLLLDGSWTIVEKLEELGTSYLFYTFRGARHEISGMPFDHLPQVFSFLKEVVFNNKEIQSKVFK